MFQGVQQVEVWVGAPSNSGRMARADFVKYPVLSLTFDRSVKWEVGQRLAGRLKTVSLSTEFEGTVLAVQGRTATVWMTSHSVEHPAQSEPYQKPDSTYVTLAHEGREIKSAAVDVSESALRVKAPECIAAGSRLTATVHVGLLPMALECRAVRCCQPVGSHKVDVLLEIAGHGSVMFARWKHYVRSLAARAT